MTNGSWWFLFKALVPGDVEFGGSVDLEGSGGLLDEQVLCFRGVTGAQHSDGAWCAVLSLNMDSSPCPCQ